MPLAVPLANERDEFGRSKILKKGPNRYTMVCTIAGLTQAFRIAWWARDLNHAEASFGDWLDKGYGVISRTFFDLRCRYVFRTGAVTGFTVESTRPDDWLDEIVDFDIES